MNKEKKTTKTDATPKKRNAAQTIEALENMLLGQNQQIEVLAEEIDKLRQMLIALNKRVNASIQAAEEGGLNGESVNKIIMNENIKELESKVQFLVDQGVLKKNDGAEITDKTFVVGRELDAKGAVVNPRVQFAVGSIDNVVKEKLLLKKTGDVVSYNENEPSLEITEVYEINQPNVQRNFEPSQATQQS